MSLWTLRPCTKNKKYALVETFYGHTYFSSDLNQLGLILQKEDESTRL